MKTLINEIGEIMFNGSIISIKLLLLSLFLFLILSSNANALLIIEPSSTDIVIFQNQETKQEITITNTHNFTIYNITFSSNQYITYPQIDALGINQSIKKNVTIKSTSIFSRTAYPSTIIFFYLADITLPAITYNVTINDTEFTPTRLTIFLGDSVKWFNNGSLSHTITHSTFDDTLLPNQSITKTFNSEQFIDYQDLNIGFHGYINITQRPQQFATNPSFNRNFIINLESKAQASSVEFEITPKDYNVRHIQVTEGLVRVKNIANITAINIHFTDNSQWISYQDNGFNMTPQQNRFIVFKIKPLLQNITESNKTYVFDLAVSGDNTNSVSDKINVFVPFEDTLLAENGSQIEDCLIENSPCWILRKAFCDTYPYSPACNPVPRKEIIEKPIYIESQTPYNYSEKEIRSFLTRLQTIEENIDKTNKFSNEKINSIEGVLSIMSQVLEQQKIIANQSLYLSEENKQRADNFTISTISVIIGITIVSSIIIIGYYTIKLKKRRRVTEINFPRK